MAILDVQRKDQGEGSSMQYVYNYRPSRDLISGAAEQAFTVDLTRPALEAFCRQIADVVDRSYHVGTTAGIDHVAELRKPGNLLYKALFPALESYLPALVGRLGKTGELLIRTDDPLVPWELVHDGDTFFGLKYELSCRPVVGTRVATGRAIGALRKVLLVADPRGDLPESQREAEQLADYLSGYGATCTTIARSDANLMKVLDELAFGGYDLLHYSGHVALSEESGEAELLLHGDDALDIRTIKASLSGGPAADPDGSQGSAPPLVCINGCESAGRLSNLCSAFMATGSQIVVGTRYAVPEEPARRFAELFYVRVIAGQTAGAAMRESRELVSFGPDAAWAAFALFGDPAARVVEAKPGLEAELEEEADRARESEPAAAKPEPVPEPAPEAAAPVLPEPLVSALDDDARAVMERAGAGGALTSMHLLVALLGTDGHPLADAVEEAGIAPSSLAGELEPLIEGEVPPAPGGSVPVSETVVRVVARATELARGAGREVAAIADLDRALVEAEAGTAAKILMLLGITAGKVAPAAGEESAPGRRPAGRGMPEDRPESLFDDDGMLVTRYVEDSTLAALHAARTMAASQGQMVGSHAALLGFGAAGSSVLHDALLRLDEDGGAHARFERGRRRLEDAQGLQMKDFSSRTFQALERAMAAAAEAGPTRLDDATLLRELLADDDSAARKLMKRLGIDPDRVIAALDP